MTQVMIFLSLQISKSVKQHYAKQTLKFPMSEQAEAQLQKRPYQQSILSLLEI